MNDPMPACLLFLPFLTLLKLLETFSEGKHLLNLRERCYKKEIVSTAVATLVAYYPVFVWKGFAKNKNISVRFFIYQLHTQISSRNYPD